MFVRVFGRWNALLCVFQIEWVKGKGGGQGGLEGFNICASCPKIAHWSGVGSRSSMET